MPNEVARCPELEGAINAKNECAATVHDAGAYGVGQYPTVKSGENPVVEGTLCVTKPIVF